jgi:23S rRNA pseudouridine1911/1915/1917 synthase
LGFIHPITQKEVMFESDLPRDMSGVIEKWRAYISTRKNNEL